MLTTLKLPPTGFTKRIPHPVYYYNEKEHKGYIIITPYAEESDKCYKYDIAENKWMNFTNYPKGLEPRCHALVVDQEMDLLYFTHGHKEAIFATFDMITSEWNIMVGDYNITRIPNGNICVLPKSQLYFFQVFWGLGILL